MHLRSVGLSVRGHAGVAALCLALGLWSSQAMAQAAAPPSPPPLLGVLAAGSASSPPSLTSVTQGQRAIIDTVQPLHPAARPLFHGLRLGPLAEQPADALLGWQRATGEVVLVPKPAGDAAPRNLRLVRRTQDLRLYEGDQVLVVLIHGAIALPDPAHPGVPDGRVLTLKVMGPDTSLMVANVDHGQLGLRSGQALQLIASKELRTWLVIGRS